MIIGVDSGALSIRDERLKVGVWRVTYNLLRELGKLDLHNEYRLYSFLPVNEKFGKNFCNVVLPRTGWATVHLPIELYRHPVDVYLGLSQALPPTSARKIGFIYDLGFLRYPDAYPGSLTKLKNQTKQLVAHADDIVAISKTTQRDITAHYGATNITIAYPGVDARFTPHGPKHKEKHPYILFVGALKRGKNIPMALRIFKRFGHKTGKEYNFLIVGGDYWNDPEIQSNVTRNVILTGFISDSALPSYYRGADALLITSLWEGFCLPAVEAMACGCPVVYAKSGSLPEIVGASGSAYDDELEAVRALMKTKRPSTGINRAKRFNWEKFASKVYEIINTQ
jgi:glycosyltransferase involved in cell wall biosynthesis